MMKRYYLSNTPPTLYLSRRQAQCMAYFVKGYTNAEVAEILHLSVRTIDAYVIDMRKKMSCRSKKEMIKYVIETTFMNDVDKLTNIKI